MQAGNARTGLSAGQRQALDGTRFTVRWVSSTGSTNDDLRSAAAEGAPEGTVLVADHQSAGHGRRGRTWEAPPGSSLLVSILLRPPMDPEDLHLVTTAVGVAAAEAVDEELAVPVGLKWPNDLVVATPRGRAQAGRDPGRDHLVGRRSSTPWWSASASTSAGPTRVPDDAGRHRRRPRPPDRPRRSTGATCWSRSCCASRRSWPTPEHSALLERWRHLATTLGRDVRVELASGAVIVGRGHRPDRPRSPGGRDRRRSSRRSPPATSTTSARLRLR